MKSNAASFPSILASSLIGILGSSCTREGGPTSVPGPASPSSKEVTAYIALPSLEKVLKDVSAVAERFAPGKVTPEVIKAQIGGMLGDPKLSGLELDRPIAVLVMKAAQPGAPPLFTAMIPVKPSAPYGAALEGIGLKSQLSGGLLLVSQTPEGLDAASKARGTYDQIAGAGFQKTARLYIQVAALLDAYGSLIDSQLDGLLGTMTLMAGAARAGPGAMDPESMQKMLKLEVRGFLALLRQSEEAQIDFDLSGQAIAIDKVVTAKPGSALAEAFTGSSRRPSPSARIIEGGGFLMGTGTCDAKAFASLAKQILDGLTKESGDLIPEQAVALVAGMGNVWGGSGSFSILPGKEGPFKIESVLDVVDEGKYLEMMEKAMAMVGPGTALGKMYKDMGVDVNWEKAARQHAGTSVHRCKMSMTAPEKDGAAPLAPDVAMMRAWIKDMELALTRGTGIASNEPADLDRMIDETQSSSGRVVTLEAQKAFGAGCHAYLDYDIFGLLKSLVGKMPKDKAADTLSMFGNVTSTAPTLIAVTFADARARLQARVPLEPFAQLKVPGR